MPRRMPNWNRRANALTDGNPITSVWRMPSVRIFLHDANEAQNRLSGHETVSV